MGKDLFLNYSRINDNSTYGYGTPDSRVLKEITEKTGVRLNITTIIMAGSRNEAVSIFNEMKATMNTMGMGDLEKYWTAKSNAIKAAFGEDKLILKGADSVIYHNLYD